MDDHIFDLYSISRKTFGVSPKLPYMCSPVEIRVKTLRSNCKCFVPRIICAMWYWEHAKQKQPGVAKGAAKHKSIA